jgi:hypothetical protein
LDGSGNELWRRSIVDGEMGFALHPDGIVYIIQTDYKGNNATYIITPFAIDELTGTTKFSIQLPFPLGDLFQPFPGLPSVLPDGNLYLPVAFLANFNSPDFLQLLKVAPDGTSSLYPVSTAPCYGGRDIEAHEAVPDGQGGVLVTWVNQLCGINSIQPVRVTHMSTSGQILGQYPLPLARQRLGSYFSDNDGDAILGEQHLFVTDGRQSAVGFNLSTSSIDLNWQTAPCASYPCPKVSLAGVAAGDRLIVNQTGNSDGSSKLFALTPSANSCPTPPCYTSTAASVPNATLLAFDFFIDPFLRPFATLRLTDLYFFVVSSPVAPSAAGAGAIWVVDAAAPAPDVIPAVDRLPPWSEVSEDGKRESAKFDFELVWCQNGICSDRTDEQGQRDKDVALTYYQDNPQNAPNPFVNLTSAQIKTIQLNTLNALKLAFVPYNVHVGTGGRGTNTLFIVGQVPKWDAQTAGPPCGITAIAGFSESSTLYYIMHMEQAQWALNLQTATPTPSLLQSIGEGIGNNGAHEIAHQLKSRSGQLVAGMDDNSTDTYNSGGCNGRKAPWVFTGVGTDGTTPIHWGTSSDQSLTNILGKRE